MYALASPWRSLGSAAFAWQACDNLHCHGVGCTPWRPSGVPWAPPLLRGRRGTISIATGSDVRPGVPLASLSLPPSLPPSHSLTHSLPLTLSLHRFTHPLTHSFTLSLTLTHSHSLTHTHSLTFTHSPSLTLTHSHSLTHPHSLSHPSLTHTTFTSLTHTLTLSPVHAHTYIHTHTHTCSEMSYRIVDVECIGRAKTPTINRHEE